MRDQIKCQRHGTLKIVSSGYSDRYVMSDIHFDISVNGLEFRIDNEDDRVAALLRLMGHDLQNVPDDIFKSAVQTAHSAPFSMWITYKTGTTTRTFTTTYAKITAGIHAALGYNNLNAWGRSQHEPIVKTLTSDEWGAIRYGLDRINEEHAKTGKPIVGFTIPEMEA